ncbi:MAG: glycosyltransferase family 2 protein [Planctomycetota bacterium]
MSHDEPDQSAPAVSVILPAFNAANTIASAIQSVREQTFGDWELIVVDDGSSDETWTIVSDLTAERENERAIRLEQNQGLAAARNTAIAAARGEWIALLDADDTWTPEKLDRCMTFLDEHPHLRVVYTPMAPVREDGTAMAGHSKPCHAGWLGEKLFLSIFVHDPAAVFHRDVIEEVGGFDESLRVSIGHEFWLRVSTTFEFGLINEPLALRGWSETSLTRSKRARSNRYKVRVLERFYFERGGKDVVPREKAMKRLAKVNYHAGKALLAEGKRAAALPYLRKALRYRPTYLRVWGYLIRAKLGAWLLGGGEPAEPLNVP